MSQAPVVRIDLSSAVPAYRQIANALRTHLVNGVFPVGQALPTIRQLAVALAVHPNTVAEAYRVLAEEGWLDLRRRHGAVVLDRSRPRPSRQAKPSLLQRLRELTAEAQTGGLAPDDIAETMRAVAAELAADRFKKA